MRNNPLAHRERGLHINPLLNGRSIDLRGTTYPGALPKDLEPHPFSPASVSRLSRLRPGPGPDNAICHLSILFPRLRLRLRLLDCYRLPAPDSQPYLDHCYRLRFRLRLRFLDRTMFRSLDSDSDCDFSNMAAPSWSLKPSAAFARPRAGRAGTLACRRHPRHLWVGPTWFLP